MASSSSSSGNHDLAGQFDLEPLTVTPVIRPPLKEEHVLIGAWIASVGARCRLELDHRAQADLKGRVRINACVREEVSEGLIEVSWVHVGSICGAESGAPLHGPSLDGCERPNWTVSALIDQVEAAAVPAGQYKIALQ